MALLVWSRGCIPESPGHEMQPDRRLPGTCPGAGRQRQGPGPSLVETHRPTQGSHWSCEQGPHGAPLLPCPESDSRKRKTLISGCLGPAGLPRGLLTGGGQGWGRRGSTCCLPPTGASLHPALTQPLLMLWGTFRGSALIDS